MILPSGNTIVEPFMARFLMARADRVTAHYTRVGVTSVSTGATDQSARIVAAILLADAGVHAIVWHGTGGLWRSLEGDESLCRAITAATGIAATTAALAVVDVIERARLRRIALAVPYTDDIRASIETTLRNRGIACPRWAGLGLSDRIDRVEPAVIRELIASADHPDAEAIVVACTNFGSAWLVDELRTTFRKPIIDATHATAELALQIVAGIRAVK